MYNAGASQSIIMDDIDAEAAELLLQYIYGCLKPELTVAAAVALFRASDKYAMSSLHQQCTRLLQSLITFDNLCDLAELAELHHSTELLQVGILFKTQCTRSTPDGTSEADAMTGLCMDTLRSQCSNHCTVGCLEDARLLPD